jgi:hypothetical protein
VPVVIGYRGDILDLRLGRDDMNPKTCGLISARMKCAYKKITLRARNHATVGKQCEHTLGAVIERIGASL